MSIQTNVELAPYTSFGLGGNAENFVEVHSSEELIEVLKNTNIQPIWLLGYGSNTLISEKGLDGLVICLRGGVISINDTMIEADAGAWWDDVVQAAIDNGLWGIELMSEIPGSVGGAAYINITAYGQSIGPLIEAVDVWDTGETKLKRISRHELKWDYKSSIFQNHENADLVILKVWLRLLRAAQPVTYQKVIDIASEQNTSLETLEGRRTATIKARERAGSLWKPGDKNAAHTAGSFFRNPHVSDEVAKLVMQFDESGKTQEEIKSMNTSHGGKPTRVSAAHVMLAAGFRRGQQWGRVKLNAQNLLKIEALPGATSQEVYDVIKNIQRVVLEKLSIDLKPEARILGDFS